MSKINYKFILIGNSGVGKTSIFKKLSTGEFRENSIASIGIDKITLDVSIKVKEGGKSAEKKFEISLLDTAGQEQFRAITRNYYKGSDGILLIYDITDKSSFDSIGNWIGCIKSSIDNDVDSKYAIILIGNKLDKVNDKEFERQITEEEAKNICKNYDMIWGGEHSTKTIKQEDLIKLFNSYVEEVYKSIGVKKIGKQKLKKGKKYEKKINCFF